MTQEPTTSTDPDQPIRAYLESLRPQWIDEQTTAIRGESQARLDAVEKDIAEGGDEDVMKVLLLTAERTRLRAIVNASVVIDRGPLEAEFVRRARAFSDRHKIPWAAWREMGVDVRVLRAAGIEQTGVGARERQPKVVERAPRTVLAGSTEKQYNLILDALREHGPVIDPNGGAGTKLGKMVGLTAPVSSSRLRELGKANKIVREIHGKRTMWIGLPEQRK